MWLVLPAVLLLGGCLDLSWKEGIPCGARERCPGALRCCGGACQARCEADAAPTSPGPDAAPLCPAREEGCFGCTPGCPCSCGGAILKCCVYGGLAPVCGGC